MRQALRRIALLATATAAVAAASSAAHAGEDVFTTTDLAIELRLRNEANTEWVTVSETADGFPLKHAFNNTRCLCAQEYRDEEIPDDPETTVAAHLTFEPQTSKSSAVMVQVWAGTDCDADLETSRHCGEAAAALVTVAAVKEGEDVHINVAALLDPDDEGCPTSNKSVAIYAMTNEDGDTEFEDVEPETIDADPQRPPLPTSFVIAAGAEGAITLEWETPAGAADEIYKWQVLCAEDTVDEPVADMPDIKAAYETPEAICGLSSIYAVEFLNVNDPELEVDAGIPPGSIRLEASMLDLDEDFICGETAGTDTSIRIEGLTNGVPYQVILVAVDEAGNYRAASPDTTLIPRPATDFWEDLHDQGSTADGGFCLIAETYGDGGGPGGALTETLRNFRDQTLASSGFGRWLTAVYYDHLAPIGELARGSIIARVVLAVVLLPVVAIALLWHVLTLPGLLALALGLLLWRRQPTRRHPTRWQPRWRALRPLRPALAAAATLLVLAAAPSSAGAQSFTPYWDDEIEIEEAGPEAVKWHVGFKLGPYIPGIDKQLGMGEGNGPYHEMYGGYRILPVLEIDRFLAWPRGQLGVGGSVGFMSQTANAYLTDVPGRERSAGDETSFRVLPLTIGATYRLTLLDDDYGIPVVPYARAGLAYYLWWITAPNGDIATVCADGSDDEMCSVDKARGASLGLQGSIGLAVRAERIDPNAALSMRDTGIYHAGFFVEYQLAWVNGFGRDSKLDLGDNTFFAGIDFEF